MLLILMTLREQRQPSTLVSPPLGLSPVYHQTSLNIQIRQPFAAVLTEAYWHGTLSTRSSLVVVVRWHQDTSRATLNSSLITMYVRFQLPNCSQFGTETTVVLPLHWIFWTSLTILLSVDRITSIRILTLTDTSRILLGHGEVWCVSWILTTSKLLTSNI